MNTVLLYAYGNVITPPPNLGQIRGDQVALHTMTKLWVHTTSTDNIDYYLFWRNRAKGNALLLQDKNAHADFIQYTIQGVPLDLGTYFEVPVAYSAGPVSVTWPNGKQLAVFISGAEASGGETPTGKKCLTCSYFDPIASAAAQGYCRVVPPAPGPTTGLWPMCNSNDWCARWQQR